MKTIVMHKMKFPKQPNSPPDRPTPGYHRYPGIAESVFKQMAEQPAFQFGSY